MKSKLALLAVIAAALSLNISASSGQSCCTVGGSINRAIVSSPRYLEEHPELLRSPAPVTIVETKAARLDKQLANAVSNRALAASPRFLEEHPELLRVQASPAEIAARAERNREQLAKIAKNKAIAASPRTLEQFPELTRGYLQSTEERIEVAPLK